MELEESLSIIEGVFIEYMDSRTYQRYLFDNLLMQFNSKGMSYLDYIKESKKVVNTKTDYVKTELENKKLLEKFRKQGAVINN
jgi:hypothetical protein|nr:MAG TPA: hypothetical protein [Caudoviricetes sp.]